MLTRRVVHQTRFFSPRWAAAMILGPLLGLIAELMVLMVAGASKPDGPALVAFFAVLTLPLMGMAAWVAGLTLRPVTLTRSALRIPSGFKTVVIPLDDVAGVGLLYHSFRPRTQPASAWSAFVWRRNGSVQRAGTLICRCGVDATEPNRQKPRRADGHTPARQDPCHSGTCRQSRHTAAAETREYRPGQRHGGILVAGRSHRSNPVLTA